MFVCVFCLFVCLFVSYCNVLHWPATDFLNVFGFEIMTSIYFQYDSTDFLRSWVFFWIVAAANLFIILQKGAIGDVYVIFISKRTTDMNLSLNLCNYIRDLWLSCVWIWCVGCFLAFFLLLFINQPWVCLIQSSCCLVASGICLLCFWLSLISALSQPNPVRLMIQSTQKRIDKRFNIQEMGLVICRPSVNKLVHHQLTIR